MIRKIRIELGEYEHRVLLKLKEVLGKDARLTHKGNLIQIKDILLNKSDSPHQIHILFREETRPECLFGFRMEAVENTAKLLADSIILSSIKGYWGPEDWANMVIATHFEEQIEDIDTELPSDCISKGVTWVNNLEFE